jgi:hypothetical protein
VEALHNYSLDNINELPCALCAECSGDMLPFIVCAKLLCSDWAVEFALSKDIYPPCTFPLPFPRGQKGAIYRLKARPKGASLPTLDCKNFENKVVNAADVFSPVELQSRNTGHTSALLLRNARIADKVLVACQSTEVIGLALGPVGRRVGNKSSTWSALLSPTVQRVIDCLYTVLPNPSHVRMSGERKVASLLRVRLRSLMV